MAMKVQIEGEVARKSTGVGDDGKPYWSATVDYMGGSQAVYFDSADEFAQFPAEEEDVVLLGKGKIRRDGKFSFQLGTVSRPEDVKPVRRSAQPAS